MAAAKRQREAMEARCPHLARQQNGSAKPWKRGVPTSHGRLVALLHRGEHLINVLLPGEVGTPRFHGFALANTTFHIQTLVRRLFLLKFGEVFGNVKNY